MLEDENCSSMREQSLHYSDKYWVSIMLQKFWGAKEKIYKMKKWWEENKK
jgi:hypothetical protein